jgi:hypothetical protein
MSKPEKDYYSTKSWFPEQVPCVIVEGEHVPVKNVETLNCEEDSSGRDLLTFLWKGEQKQSFVVLKYL